MIQERLQALAANSRRKTTERPDWPAHCISGEDGTPLPFHRAQQIAFDAPTRVVALIAGTQGGKTAFVPWWMNAEIRRRGAGDYLAVSANYDLFKLRLLPEYLKVFQDILKIGKYYTGDKVMEICDPEGNFHAGRSTDPMYARIILRSAASPGGLESSTVQGMTLDEAGMDDFTLDAWRALQRRGAIHRARILITTTLYNLGWLKQQVIDRALDGGTTTSEYTDKGGEITVTTNAEADITLIQFDSTVNPKFSSREFEEARATMPENEFAMMYRGLVMRPRDLIYDCFDEKDNTCPRFTIDPTWRRYAGIDFGGTNTAALFFALDPTSGTYYCYREYMGGKKTAKEHVPDLLDGEVGIPRFYGGAQGEGQWRREFALAGIPIREPDAKDVWLGINRVYSAIKLRKVIFFRDLEGTMDQLLRYRRKRGRDGNPTSEIENKNDQHYADALRYAIGSVFGGIGWARGTSE